MCHYGSEHSADDEAWAGKNEGLENGLPECMDVHDKCRLKDEGGKEREKHEVRIDVGYGSIILRKGEFGRPCGQSNEETHYHQDDSVRERGMLQNMPHQSCREEMRCVTSRCM